jgi:hypothetical protein
MIDWSILNAACLSTFAETVLFKLMGGDVPLQAVFDIERPKDDIGAAPFSNDYYTLELLQSDINANGIALRDTVTVRGVDYQILEIADDTAGMAMLKIRRY